MAWSSRPLHGVQIRSSQCIHECTSVSLQPPNHDTHDSWFESREVWNAQCSLRKHSVQSGCAIPPVARSLLGCDSTPLLPVSGLVMKVATQPNITQQHQILHCHLEGKTDMNRTVNTESAETTVKCCNWCQLFNTGRRNCKAVWHVCVSHLNNLWADETMKLQRKWDRTIFNLCCSSMLGKVRTQGVCASCREQGEVAPAANMTPHAHFGFEWVIWRQNVNVQFSEQWKEVSNQLLHQWMIISCTSRVRKAATHHWIGKLQPKWCLPCPQVNSLHSAGMLEQPNH